MQKTMAEITTAPGYCRYNKAPPPSFRSCHPGEFPFIIGNFAGETQRREIHTFLNNSMQKETS
jgi:hypothetical protein